MQNIKLTIALFLTSVILISSCQKETVVTEPFLESEKSHFQEGMIQLGEKLNNPYTVENMRKAYQNITKHSQLKSSDITEADIEVTHFYVRFLPKSERELGILHHDTLLELFDYPLDYEMHEGGTYYHDPNIPDTAITWQYTVVEKEFVFPVLEYEILAELFLPETMLDSKTLKSTEDWTFWDELEVEALKMTGNYEEAPSLKSTNGLIRKKWKPSGKIRVEDNSGLGYPPVIGCKVRAYSWFTIKSDLTDGEGKFYINHNFKGHVNYSIKWERNDFDIRSGNWGQAYFNGPRYKEKAWDQIIWKSIGMSWVYAHIHRGAYTYYYANRWGIKTPPKNGGFLKTRIKIGAMDKSGRAHYYDFNKFFTTPQIKIYRKDSYGNENSSGDLFETAVHELAHASHWEIGYTYGQYVVDAIFSEPFLPESWAQGVGVKITTDTYGYDWNTWQAKTTSSLKSNGGYTPIVWDMMDDYNQRDKKGSAYPIDRVKNYTLNQLEGALYGTNTWNGWRDNIKSKYPDNSTKDYLIELFKNYK